MRSLPGKPAPSIEQLRAHSSTTKPSTPRSKGTSPGCNIGCTPPDTDSGKGPLRIETLSPPAETPQAQAGTTPAPRAAALMPPTPGQSANIQSTGTHPQSQLERSSVSHPSTDTNFSSTPATSRENFCTSWCAQFQTAR